MAARAPAPGHGRPNRPACTWGISATAGSRLSPAKGGVIRLNGFPAFVGTRCWRTVDDFVDHALHIANLVGTDNLSVGVDYYHGRAIGSWRGGLEPARDPAALPRPSAREDAELEPDRFRRDYV